MKKLWEAKWKLQMSEEGNTKKAKKQMKTPAKKKGHRSAGSKDSSEESAEEASKDPSAYTVPSRSLDPLRGKVGRAAANVTSGS